MIFIIIIIIIIIFVIVVISSSSEKEKKKINNMSSKIFIVCLFRGGQKHMKTEACFITARARARAPATCAPLFILFPAMRARAALRIINGEGARAAVRGAARAQPPHEYGLM